MRIYIPALICLASCSSIQKSDNCEQKLEAAMSSLANGQLKMLRGNKEIMDGVRASDGVNPEIISNIKSQIRFNILAVRQVAPEGFAPYIGEKDLSAYCEMVANPSIYGLSQEPKENQAERIAYDFLNALTIGKCGPK